MKALSSKLHFTLYFWSIAIFAVSIHWWHSFTVIITVIIGLLWIIQPNLLSKLQVFFKKPTILFSATPYRNDYKVFNIDKEKFYAIEHEFCTTQKFLRELKLNMVNIGVTNSIEKLIS